MRPSINRATHRNVVFSMLVRLFSLRMVAISCLMIFTLTPLRSAAIQDPGLVRFARISGKRVSASVGDQILGRWYFPLRESDIEVYRENDRYFARIVAVSQATTIKFGTMTNKLLLTDLSFAGDEWAGGQLIHPQTGNRFDVFLKLADANTLVITAYKGCRLFSKSYTLTRL